MRDDPARPNPQHDARLKATMRARGWLRVTLVTIAIDELLTAVFGYLAQRIDANVTIASTLAFSLTTCALVSYWLLVDARNAWRFALAKGHVRRGPAEDGEDFPRIDNCCPRRWLVVLHLELNPDLARSI
jgi:hypothetical protein